MEPLKGERGGTSLTGVIAGTAMGCAGRMLVADFFVSPPSPAENAGGGMIKQTISTNINETVL
jgi:hypothetical protein